MENESLDVDFTLTELIHMADLVKSVFGKINPESNIDWENLSRRIGRAYLTSVRETERTVADERIFEFMNQDMKDSENNEQFIEKLMKVTNINVPIELDYSEMMIIRDMVSSDVKIFHPVFPGKQDTVGFTLIKKLFEAIEAITGEKKEDLKTEDIFAEIEKMGISTKVEGMVEGR